MAADAHTTPPGGGGPLPPAGSEGALRAAREALAGLPEPVAATLRGLLDAALAEAAETISDRDVVMILGDHWNGCLVLVTEVRAWGIQGFVRIPMSGDAYIRVANGDFVRVGRLPEDVRQAGE
jgi:hypothetical protein